MTAALYSDAELRKLTGYARPLDQRRWLTDNGIPHILNGRGCPVVFGAVNTECPSTSRITKGARTMCAMGRPKSVWHDLPPRMKGRRLASGKVLYYYQTAGKNIPLGSDRLEANRKWAELEAREATDTLPAIAKLFRAATFKGLAASTQAHYEIALRNLEVTFRKAALQEIKPADVKKYIRERPKKRAALFERKVLSALFNWARGEGHTDAPNPCAGITFSASERKGFGPGKRSRYVTWPEFDAVYARGDDILQDTMDLILFCGQRPSDVLPLKRTDIRDGALWIVQKKTGKKMGVRVEGDLERIIKRITTRSRKVPSLYLIADRNGQRVKYNALHARFKKALGAGDWQLRDLRAKAASDSPDLKRAQELLGHATEVVTAGVYRRARGTMVAPLSR